MGVDYTAQVVVGFELTFGKITKTRKKYNEDTGASYEIEEFSHIVASVDDIDVASNEDNPGAFCEGEKIEDLEIFKSGYQSGTKVLGILVATADDYEGDHAAFPLDLTSAACQPFADKYGVTPQGHLLLRCS
jgi:hypothetical protein